LVGLNFNPQTQTLSFSNSPTLAYSPTNLLSKKPKIKNTHKNERHLSIILARAEMKSVFQIHNS
jgi:hypothetical protein